MPSSTQPLKLAYFSPLPPEPSGISDYSRELLPYLSNLANIHLYIDDYSPIHEIAWRYPFYNYREFPWRRPVASYDFAVYHLGNSPMHGYLYPYIARYPGVVVLHDWVLHHFLAGLAQHGGRAGYYFRELADEAGAQGADIAWQVITGNRTPPYFDYPLIKRSIEASLGIIVHSEFVRERVQTAVPGKPVAVVPMGVPLPPESEPKPALRARLGLPVDAFIIGSFGLATPYKRISTVLRALAALVTQGIDAHYVVVGEVAANYDLAGEISALGLTQRVHVTGYIPEADFTSYLQSVDVCVNLRYPTAGETSASALRCLAAGQPTIVSNVDANRELPDDCLLKVPVGDEEEAMLTQVLQVLVDNPEIRQTLGATAREYIGKEHTLERAARGYISFLSELQASAWQRWQPPTVPTEVSHIFRRKELQDIVGHLRSLRIDDRNTPVLKTVAAAIADLKLGNTVD